MMVLNPCPFCGAKARLFCTSSGYTKNDFQKIYRLECSGCGCVLGTAKVSIEYDPERGAYAYGEELRSLVELWNGRG